VTPLAFFTYAETLSPENCHGAILIYGISRWGLYAAFLVWWLYRHILAKYGTVILDTWLKDKDDRVGLFHVIRRNDLYWLRGGGLLCISVCTLTNLNRWAIF